MKHRLLAVLLVTICMSTQAQPELAIQDDHSHTVQGLVWSPDGKQLISYDDMGYVKIWEYPSGKVIRSFREPFQEIQGIDFPGGDNKIMVVRTSSRVFFINYTYGTTIRQGNVGESRVFVDENGKFKILARVGGIYEDEAFSLLDGETFNVISKFTLPCPNDPRLWMIPKKGFEVTTDGKFMIRQDIKQDFYIYDVATGAQVRKASALDRPTVYPFDKTKFAMHSNAGGLALVDATTGKLEKLKELTREIKNNLKYQFLMYKHELVVYSNPGRKLIGTIDPYSHFNKAEKEYLGNDAKDVLSPTVTPDEKFVIGGHRKRIRVWDLATLQEVESPFTANLSATKSVAISPDGKIVAAGKEDGTVKLFSLLTGRLEKSFLASTEPVSYLAFLPDQKHMITKVGEQTFVVWDMTTYKSVGRWSMENKAIFSMNVSDDGSKLIVYAADWYYYKQRQVFDIMTGKKLSAVGKEKAFNAEGSRIMASEFSPDSAWYVTADYEKPQVLISRANFSTQYQLNKKFTDIVFTGNREFIGATGNLIIKGTIDETANKVKYTTLFAGHSEQVTSLALSPDKKLLISGSDDNSVRIWNAATGEELVAVRELAVAYLINHERQHTFNKAKGGYSITIKSAEELEEEYRKERSFSEEYVVTTPEGYYMSTPMGNEVLHFVDGTDVYDFDQFDLTYNRPDKVVAKLGLAPKELTDVYKKAWEKRIQKLGLKPADFEATVKLNAPEVSLTFPTEKFMDVVAPKLILKASVYDGLYNITKVHVYVNGVPVFGKRGQDLSDKKSRQFELEIPIELGDGKNQIELSVTNDRGVESNRSKFEVTYNNPAPVKPDLYVVTIGVSQFSQSEFNLTYAAKDAQDLAKAFQGKTDRFGKVNVITIADKDATKENILKAKETLMQSRITDVVVVSVASHGLLDNNLDYFIATTNVAFAAPQERGLSYEDFENLFDGIPSRNKLVFIDACHSGEVDKEDVQLVASNTADPAGVKSRGFKSVKSNEESKRLVNSFELMRQLFADLRKGTGAVVISSASGKEFAFESEQWKNGVFTFSVVEGLTTKNADLNKDGAVKVSELKNYVSKKVQELTNGKQNPTSRSDNFAHDFIVW